MTSSECQLEQELIEKLKGLKYELRTDIRGSASLELNVRKKFQELNRVELSDGEFQHLLDEAKKMIVHLDDFAATFLVKCTLDYTISRYMMLIASGQKVMMMRPYQIYAVRAIVDCIHQNCGNGYIWYTTGSGKTLTSFKASTLLKDNPDMEKCLFVVDSKNLDRQTLEEFNRFTEGCVEENNNTATLVRQFSSN